MRLGPSVLDFSGWTSRFRTREAGTIHAEHGCQVYKDHEHETPQEERRTREAHDISKGNDDDILAKQAFFSANPYKSGSQAQRLELGRRS